MRLVFRDLFSLACLAVGLLGVFALGAAATHRVMPQLEGAPLMLAAALSLWRWNLLLAGLAGIAWLLTWLWMPETQTALGTWLLERSYRAEDDPLASYDNTQHVACPQCHRMPHPCLEAECLDEAMVHDPCLGHIPGATSACCGHGRGVGHVIIGSSVD